MSLSPTQVGGLAPPQRAAGGGYLTAGWVSYCGVGILLRGGYIICVRCVLSWGGGDGARGQGGGEHEGEPGAARGESLRASQTRS